MEKRKLNRSQYNWLFKASSEWVSSGVLPDETRNQILDQYETDTGNQFIRSLVLIGALLIGVGVLSFIASNWPHMSKTLKLSAIGLALMTANFSGYRLLPKYPKTARGLIFLGTLIYGAGIFLIGQMFHFSSDYPMAFMLWALGVLPLALVMNDTVLLLFSLILLMIHTVGYYDRHEQVAYWVYPLVIGLFYYEWRKPKPILFFAMSLLTVLLTWCTLSHFKVEGLIITLIYVALGIAAVFKWPYRTSQHFTGTCLYGISGLIASSQELWRLGGHSFELGAIVFSIAFGGFLLWQIRQGVILGIVLICVLIFRFYMDFTYNFMPKSLFFIIGGLILLGFGYWFERERRKGGHTHESSHT